MKISTNLSSAIGAALLELCVMGFVAIFAVHEIHDLGADLQAESMRLARLETDVAVRIERAVGEVSAAPAELDLVGLKLKQDRFQALLAGALNAVAKSLPDNSSAALKAPGATIGDAVSALQTASLKVFALAAAFAQPDAIAMLQDVVGPKRTALQEALDQFDEAAMANGRDKVASIQAEIATITWLVSGLAAVFVLAIGSLAWFTVSRGTVRPLVAMNASRGHIHGGGTARRRDCRNRPQRGGNCECGE